jgi:hypothetical protein
MKKTRKKFKKKFKKLFPGFEYEGIEITPYGDAMVFKSSCFCVGIAVPVEFKGQSIPPELWAKIHTTMYQYRTMGHSQLLIWFDVI